MVNPAQIAQITKCQEFLCYKIQNCEDSTLVCISIAFRNIFHAEEFEWWLKYSLFHKTLPKSILQMHWFYEMDVNLNYNLLLALYLTFVSQIFVEINSTKRNISAYPLILGKYCAHIHSFTYNQVHKTLPKSRWQMRWISVRFYEMGDMYICMNSNVCM